MKIIIIHLISLLIIASCSNLALNRKIASNASRHIVFDIDWTLVSPAENLSHATQIIEVQGQKYRLHDHAQELLYRLFKSGNYQISFFSGGDFSRNRELLQKIKIGDNISAADIAYKILSREDLTEIEGIPSHAKFSERYKKDISKIDSNISNIIIIDDNPYFALNKEQAKRFLYLGETYKYFESYEEAMLEQKAFKGPIEELKYFPKTYREWLLNKKRLALIEITVNQNFDNAIEDWQATGIPNHRIKWSKIESLLPEEKDCLQSMKIIMAQ